jgi:ATP-dependent DNA helicase RecQ
MQDELTGSLTHILQDTFHFTEFRPGQLEAIQTLLQEDRLLCIQPTGYGKSLLYQLPALYLGGITLVISPLLALMRDQIIQLKKRFNIAAGSINTDQSYEENASVKSAALSGRIRILFIAPEQLQQDEQVNFLQQLPIKLLVIDEAHCISTWGHDFRPSYRQIIKLVHALILKDPQLKLLGLTATADSKTEHDIKQQMSVLKDIVVHRESMDRPNIKLSVISTLGTAVKLATLSKVLTLLEGSGLIYCATRENTEIVASYLSSQGIKAAAYHAGLPVMQKMQLQDDFLENNYSVIAATNALGMGIDKSDLRFVIHFDFPGSITAYYQEVGRCGRDRLPAQGILLYDPADSKVQQYFIMAAQPTDKDFEKVHQVIASSISPLDLPTIKRLSGLHPTKLSVVMAELIEQEFIEKSLQFKTQLYCLTNKRGLPNLSRYIRQFESRRSDLKNMQYFAEQPRKCLMSILRSTLGDTKVHNCGQCSVCSKALYRPVESPGLLLTISSWLNRRTLPLHLSKIIKGALPGLSVLDGKLRANDFKLFMHARKNNDLTQLGLSEALSTLIKDCLKDLIRHYQFSCIVVVPSLTWKGREAVVNLLGNFLKVPVLTDLLLWKDQPLTRQGELLNNEQRQHNVAQRMQVSKTPKFPRLPILLFDDYTGSGATLNEAARALREQGNITNQIIPFTIAAVKWRIGHSGMV